MANETSTAPTATSTSTSATTATRAGSARREVIVVGGGPAGSTAANLLAHAGHDVLVLEKEVFPRFHIGESLLPIDLPIFKRLGVDLDGATFLRKDGAEFIDEKTGQQVVFSFAEGLTGIAPNAYQVERAAFDHVLLLAARARGAEVREGVRVERITIAPDDVSVETGGETIRARFLIDATGQDAFLGRTNRTVEPLKGFGRVAVFRHYHGLAPEIARELGVTGNIKVLMVPEGWMWLIPLTGARLSVGLVSREATNSPEALEHAIAISPIIQRLTAGASGTAPKIIRNFSYKNLDAAGARWACIGDAACFLDPVFSSGVSLAMLSAESLADLLSPALRDGTEARPELLAAHAARMEIGYRSFAGLIGRFYDHAIVRNLFFAGSESEAFKPGIISVLGGDLWRDDNPFQKLLLSSQAAQAAWAGSAGDSDGGGGGGRRRTRPR
jgi:flavin-dependent dehydrogenase